MPPGAINVCRPCDWGNPFKVGDLIKAIDDGENASFVTITPELAVYLFRLWIAERRFVDQIRRELRGKDLVCWCPLISPDGRVFCHADVLLSVANDTPLDEVQSENHRRTAGQAL